MFNITLIVSPSNQTHDIGSNVSLLPPPKQGEERTLTNIARGPQARGQYQSMFSPHPVLGGVIRALQPSNVSHLGWVILLDIAQARAAIQAKGHIQYCLVGSIDLPRPFHRQTALTNVAQQATLVNVVQQVTLLLRPQDDLEALRAMLATRQHCPILPARQHWSMLSSGGMALVSQCCLLDNIGCVPLPGQLLWSQHIYPVQFEGKIVHIFLSQSVQASIALIAVHCHNIKFTPRYTQCWHKNSGGLCLGKYHLNGIPTNWITNIRCI